MSGGGGRAAKGKGKAKAGGKAKPKRTWREAINRARKMATWHITFAQAMAGGKLAEAEGVRSPDFVREGLPAIAADKLEGDLAGFVGKAEAAAALWPKALEQQRREAARADAERLSTAADRAVVASGGDEDGALASAAVGAAMAATQKAAEMDDQTEEQLRAAEGAAAEHKKAHSMASMLVNRANSRAIGADLALAPPKVTAPVLDIERQAHERRLVEIVKAGGVCFTLLACGEGASFALPQAADADAVGEPASLPLFRADPWQLVDACAPPRARTEHEERQVEARVHDVSLGLRWLASLKMWTRAHCGELAVKRLSVVLVVQAGTEVETLRELRERRFLGLAEERVFVLGQPSMPGLVWDAAAQRFVEDPGGPSRSLGGGWAFRQMLWRAQGYVSVSATAKGAQKVALVDEPLLDRLAALKAKYMYTMRIEDLQCLRGAAMLDKALLGYGVDLLRETQAGVCLSASRVDGFNALMECGGTVVGTGGNMALELKTEYMSNLELMEKLRGVGEGAGGESRWYTSADRYLFDLAALREALAVPSLQSHVALALSSDGGRLHPSFDVADLTLHMSASALNDPNGLIFMRGAADVRQLRKEAGEQDAVPEFQAMWDRYRGSRPAMELAHGSARRITRFHVVVVVAPDDEAASRKAYDFVRGGLLRPAVDRLTLVTVAHDCIEGRQRQLFLSTFAEEDGDILDVAREVVITEGGMNVATAISNACDRLEPSYVVIGTSNLNPASVSLGSMTLTLVKEITAFPILVVKSVAVLKSNETAGYNLSFGVTPTCFPALEFAMRLQREGRDRLLLHYGGVTSSVSGERMLSLCQERCVMNGVRAGKRVVAGGRGGGALAAYARREKVHCLLLPTGPGKLGEVEVEVLKEAPCAVFLVRRGGGGGGGGVSRSRTI